MPFNLTKVCSALSLRGSVQLVANSCLQDGFNAYCPCKFVLQFCSHREFCKRPLTNSFIHVTLQLFALLGTTILETKAILVNSLESFLSEF